MGVEQLTEKIAAEARQKAAGVAGQARKAAEDVRARAAAEVARLEVDARARAARETRTIIERARSQARLERRKVLLAAQWRAVDAVLDAAGKAVVGDSGYRELLTAMVRRHGGEGWSVRLSAQDTSRFGAELGAGEPAAISGGAVFRSGRQDVNLSLEGVLAGLREDLVSELAGILFPPRADSPGR